MYRLIKSHPDDLISVGIIIMIPFVLFWRWLLKGEVLFWGTPMLQFWPWHQLSKAALLQGEWPLWNPLLGNGTPLLANLQSAVFYPPNLIYLLMPVEHALTLSTLLHLSLAGLLMYLFARRLALAPFPATVSALTYLLSGYLVGRTQFVTMVNAAAWLPLVLLLVEQLATRRQFIDILWLAIVLAVQFLAGHAQLWFYTLCLGSAYLLFRSWQMGQLLHNLGRFALAVGLSLLLAAVQILPTAELVLHSSRSEGAERTFALTYSFWPWRLLTLLAPDFFGNPAQGNYWGYANYWEDHAYLGVLPFILAMIALVYYLRRNFRLRPQNLPELDLSRLPWRLVPFWGVLVPLSLILAMGWNTPVYLWVLELIPGFGFFQGPARLLIWYTLALSLLAGIGVQHFSLIPETKPHWRRFLAGCIALTLAGLIGQMFLAGRILIFLTATWQTGVRLILAIALLLLRPEREPSLPVEEKIGIGGAGQGPPEQSLRFPPAAGGVTWPQRLRTREAGLTIWRWAVILFIMVDLLGAAWPLQPVTPAAVFRQPIASAELLRSQAESYRVYVEDKFAYTQTFDQFFRFSDFGPAGQPGHWQRFKETLTPNFGTYAGLAAANNNDPLVVGVWQQLIRPLAEAPPDIKARLLALMHVGYVVDKVEGSAGEIFYQGQDFTIRRVPEPLPRVYFVPEGVGVSNETEALARLQSPDFEPRRQVILIGRESSPPSELAVGESPVPVIITQESFNTIELKVEAPGKGFVVLTDTYYPGWQAKLDGQPVPIQQANLAFRAVAVEAGPQLIQFRYRPMAFTFGLWTSFATWFIIGITILRRQPGTST